MTWAVALVFACLLALSKSAPLNEEQEIEVPDVEGNTGEYGDLYQGDMILPQKRNGHRSSSKRWPKGVVPYVIDSSISSSKRNIIAKAVSYYKSKTCIRWVPRTNQGSYVIFTGKSSGCFANVGRSGRSQKINLDSGCFNSFGTVLHEMMHALGFYHEQAREDRDRYITIHWDNIRSDRRNQFNIEKGSLTFGTRYDIGSVMQYGAKAFSKNGKYTITPKSGSVSSLGQRKALSSNDIRKIQAMYNNCR